MIPRKRPAYGIFKSDPKKSIERRLSLEDIQEAYLVTGPIAMGMNSGYVFRAADMADELYFELGKMAQLTRLRIIRETKGISSEEISGFALVNISKEELHPIITIMDYMAKARFVRRVNWVYDPETYKTTGIDRILGEISGDVDENFENFKNAFVHPVYINLEACHVVKKKIK